LGHQFKKSWFALQDDIKAALVEQYYDMMLAAGLIGKAPGMIRRSGATLAD
jgi:hypothetical protein